MLRDYIAFARTYIQPKLSEEAGQALVQAYVGMYNIHITTIKVVLVYRHEEVGE